MNRTPWLILGTFLAFASAWLGIVVYSCFTLGRLTAQIDEASGATVPPPLSGLALAGQRVYATEGCVSCHTQEVRPGYLSSDIEKKLGPRRMVARDYLRDQPAFIGYLRIGPDLANYALRAPDTNAIHCHLYAPAIAVPGSIMPAVRYLYKVRKISGQTAADALTGLSGSAAPTVGYEVVPTAEARELVAYLLSLKRDYPLPEAPPEPAAP